MSTPRVSHGSETNPLFALTARITEPSDQMTFEIEGDLDAATIPFLEGIFIAAEHFEAREIVLDVSRLGFVGVLGVRALADEAERLEMHGRHTRLVGASPILRRLIALTDGSRWLDGRRQAQIDDEPMRVPNLVARTIQSVVPGARCVSITSVSGRHLETLASTDPVAEQLDRVQYRHGSGPCVEAVRDQVQTVSHDLEQEPRWPEFATAAARRRIRSVLSTPLSVRPGQIPGLDGPTEAVAVNIYSERPSQFDDERRHLVAGLAAQVAQLAGAFADGGAA